MIKGDSWKLGFQCFPQKADSIAQKITLINFNFSPVNIGLCSEICALRRERAAGIPSVQMQESKIHQEIWHLLNELVFAISLTKHYLQLLAELLGLNFVNTTEADLGGASERASRHRQTNPQHRSATGRQSKCNFLTNTADATKHPDNTP